MFLELGDVSTWVYRRAPSFQLAREDAVALTTDGIRYLRPELVLLFKAKARREKDERDFTTTLPVLEGSARAQLRAWLERFHPGHFWISQL